MANALPGSPNAGYKALESTSPSAALAMATAYHADLLNAMSAAIGQNGSTYNPAPLLSLIDMVSRDIVSLQSKTRTGALVRAAPVVRTDPYGYQSRSMY